VGGVSSVIANDLVLAAASHRRTGSELSDRYRLALQNDDVPEISTGASLAVIVGVLTITTAASIIEARRNPRARVHAGSLRARDAATPEE
jgi:hypothetical protein